MHQEHSPNSGGKVPVKVERNPNGSEIGQFGRHGKQPQFVNAVPCSQSNANFGQQAVQPGQQFVQAPPNIVYYGQQYVHGDSHKMTISVAKWAIEYMFRWQNESMRQSMKEHAALLKQLNLKEYEIHNLKQKHQAEIAELKRQLEIVQANAKPAN